MFDMVEEINPKEIIGWLLHSAGSRLLYKLTCTVLPHIRDEMAIE